MARFAKMPQQVVIAIVAAVLFAFSSPGSSQAAEFSDGQLKSFAAAWMSINELAEQWKPQVEAATSQDQAKEMLKQFEAEANQVIEQIQGIGAAEYESIMQAAQSDPELKERIFAMLEAASPN